MLFSAARLWRPPATLVSAVLARIFVGLAAASVMSLVDRVPWLRLEDLHVYYGTVSTLRAGGDPYAFAASNGDPFTYPPFALLLMVPMSLFGEGAVQVGWVSLTFLAVLALACALTARWPGRPMPRSVLFWLIACVLMESAPVQSDLRFGQVSLFIVLLCFLDAAGVISPRFRGY